jgi:general secretion pathway protein F
MPRFHYKAIAKDGTVLRGDLEATSRQAAVEQLRNAGHLPVRADAVESRGGWFRLPALAWPRRDTVRQGQIVALTRELATLLNAGLPLDGALHMVEQVNEPGPLRSLIASVRSAVQGGLSLSDALEDQHGVFDRLYVNMVRAGEAGGVLHSVILRLADYLEGMASLRSSIVTALVYPAILVVVAGISLVALMTFVVPQFVPLFEDAGATLPLLTQLVFAIAGVFQSYWWLLAVLGAAGAWLAVRHLTVPANRLRFHERLLAAPILGELLKGLDTARFARTLGTLLENGVPLLSGVQLSRDVIGNAAIASDFNAVTRSLEQGRGMSRALRESGRLPPLAIQLIEVGEESGQLSEMLNRVAGIYDKEVQSTLKRLLTILEPALILGLGGIIAVIIMSILIAILSLNELIG